MCWPSDASADLESCNGMRFGVPGGVTGTKTGGGGMNGGISKALWRSGEGGGARIWDLMVEGALSSSDPPRCWKQEK